MVGLHNWTFLFGPKLALGVNTVLLASQMFRSRLVPRAIAILGLVGGRMVYLSGTAVLFGVVRRPVTTIVSAIDHVRQDWQPNDIAALLSRSGIPREPPSCALARARPARVHARSDLHKLPALRSRSVEDLLRGVHPDRRRQVE
jgi:hypothetical protein